MSVRNPNTLASTIYDKLHLEINKKEIIEKARKWKEDFLKEQKEGGNGSGIVIADNKEYEKCEEFFIR